MGGYFWRIRRLVSKRKGRLRERGPSVYCLICNSHDLTSHSTLSDIVIFVAIGVALLALLPAKQASPAGAPISEPRFAER